MYLFVVGSAQDFQKAKTLVGARIRRQRKKLGINQEDLATKALVDRKHMSSIENGKTETGFWTLTRIASVLETTPGKLVRGLTRDPDGE